MAKPAGSPRGARDSVLSKVWGTQGPAFQSYWRDAPADTRLGLLTTVRDLLRERSFPSGRGSGSALFGLLLPELSDQLLPNLTARPELLPRLILARATNHDACAAHDAQFVTVASASSGLPPETASTLAANRTALMDTFLHDVLVLYAHTEQRALAASVAGPRSAPAPAPAPAPVPAPSAASSPLAGRGIAVSGGGVYAPGAASVLAPFSPHSTASPRGQPHSPAGTPLPRHSPVAVAPPPLPAPVAPVSVAAAASRGPLQEGSVSPSPIAQFAAWFAEARQAGDVPDDGMPITLATATPEGRPSARMVLLKGVSTDGFLFFSNYQSRKGRELEANPFAAVVVYFPRLRRQVRIEGRVSKIEPEESDEYWHSRSFASRMGAWASRQSTRIPSRTALEEEVARATELFSHMNMSKPAAASPARSRFAGAGAGADAGAGAGAGSSAGGDAGGSRVIPRPDYWGGYLLTPDSMEFWQNGAARLHDRLVYNKVAAGAAAGTGAAQEGAAASAGPETEWEVSRLAP